MITITDEFQKLVLDDLKTYVSLYHPVQAGILERIFVRRLSIAKLHPNPQDEFCSLDVGPNYKIVNDYAKQIRYAVGHEERLFSEPLVCSRISTGGYMLLNGHHRWMAAHQCNVRIVPVRIVNITPEEEIIARVNASEREMCVSFDLDEVLLTDGKKTPSDRKLLFPFASFYPLTLRKSAPALIRKLQDMGFDVWVYTGGYYSEEYLNHLFKLHRIRVDGIVTNPAGKKSSQRIQKSFREKYRLSLHIDNESIICVNTRTKDYDVYDVSTDSAGWASDMARTLKGIDLHEAKS